MKLYLVRHGESESNRNNTVSHSETVLTEKGVEQAEFVAKRFETISIDLVLCSTYNRTRHTAEIINKKLNKEIIHTPLLKEIKRSTEIEGKNWQDPQVKTIRDLYHKNQELPDWHHSDEENYYDIKKRAEEFLVYVEQYKDKNNILVVTHGFFTGALISVLLFKDKFTAELLRNFDGLFLLENTSITVLEKHEEKDWQVLTWNDYAHLGEVI